MDAQHSTTWGETLLGALSVALLWLAKHIFGRRSGQVFAKQRHDGRDSRVIPRPEAVEVFTARQDVEAVRAGLAQLKDEVRHLDEKVNDQGEKVEDLSDAFRKHAESEERDRALNDVRLVTLERSIVAQVNASHADTQRDIKALIGQVGQLTGEVSTLVRLQSKAGD